MTPTPPLFPQKLIVAAGPGNILANHVVARTGATFTTVATDLM